MGIKRSDFREVRPTEDEAAEWRRKHPRRGLPYRAEHKPCGRRIWYSGIGVGAHLRACPGKPDAGPELGPCHICGGEADARCTICDRPVCDDDAGMKDYDRFCRSCAPHPGGM